MMLLSRLRLSKVLLAFFGFIFLLTCALSTHVHAMADHTVGPCQGMSEEKDGCLWAGKFHSLPAFTVVIELSGIDVQVERASPPEQEALPSYHLWKPLLSRSPPFPSL